MRLFRLRRRPERNSLSKSLSKPPQSNPRNRSNLCNRNSLPSRSNNRPISLLSLLSLLNKSSLPLPLLLLNRLRPLNRTLPNSQPRLSSRSLPPHKHQRSRNRLPRRLKIPPALAPVRVNHPKLYLTGFRPMADVAGLDGQKTLTVPLGAKHQRRFKSSQNGRSDSCPKRSRYATEYRV